MHTHTKHTHTHTGERNQLNFNTDHFIIEKEKNTISVSGTGTGEWNLQILNPVFSDCSLYTCTDGKSKAASRVIVTSNKDYAYIS